MLHYLTPDQRQALQDSQGAPVYLVDRADLSKYVLVEADAFEQFLDVVFEHGGEPWLFYR